MEKIITKEIMRHAGEDEVQIDKQLRRASGQGGTN